MVVEADYEAAIVLGAGIGSCWSRDLGQLQRYGCNVLVGKACDRLGERCEWSYARKS